MTESRRIFDETRRESVHIQPDPVKTHQNTLCSSDFDAKINDFH